MAQSAELQEAHLWQREWWRTTPADRPDRTPWPELAVLAVLIIWNLTANLLVQDALEVPTNVLGAGLLVVIARSASFSWEQLGLDRRRLATAARVGAVAAGLIVAAVALLALVPAAREGLADERFVGVDGAEVAYDVLIRIPIATALGEEIAFRGVVLGMLLAWTSPFRATLLTSLLFGLWHIAPGLAALDTTAVDVGDGSVVEAGAVAGQVLLTGLAGVIFCWLRLRGRHVLAPSLAHWALNGAALLAGWLIVQNGWV
ncbi:MAG TPA: type II CAAX endopeptidase family protein [Acidimicrobiia bacterium]|nr:type II CAAX endopeptidase family protein [Acidimicrobiia bacterium]